MITPRTGIFDQSGARVEIDMADAERYGHNRTTFISCKELKFDGYLLDSRGRREFRAGDFLCYNDFGCRYITTAAYMAHAYEKLDPAFAEPVDHLARAMVAKLSAHADKGGWDGESPWYFISRIEDELRELRMAVAAGNFDGILDECADVANFAMMLADIYGRPPKL